MRRIKPIWRFKIRKIKSSTGIEWVIKLPNEVIQSFGSYVELTIENGRLIIYPVKEEVEDATKKHE